MNILKGCKNTKILNHSANAFYFEVTTEYEDKTLRFQIVGINGLSIRLVSPSMKLLGKCTLSTGNNTVWAKFDSIPGEYSVNCVDLYLNDEDATHKKIDSDTVWTFRFGEDIITFTELSQRNSDQEKYTISIEHNIVETTAQFN